MSQTARGTERRRSVLLLFVFLHVVSDDHVDYNAAPLSCYNDNDVINTRGLPSFLGFGWRKIIACKSLSVFHGIVSPTHALGFGFSVDAYPTAMLAVVNPHHIRTVPPGISGLMSG